MEDAVAEGRSLRELEPSSAYGAFSHGLVCAQGGHEAEAIAAFRDAVTLAEGVSLYRVTLAYGLAVGGEHEEARSILADLRRREETDRIWSAEQPRHLAERLNSALTVELVETRRRYEAAEMRLHAEFEGRRREEAERLETWRRSESERIEKDLVAEEQRFSERLMRQLKEFEFQLGERQREQEQRLIQWWDEAEQLARQRVAALLDETLSKKAITGS